MKKLVRKLRYRIAKFYLLKLSVGDRIRTERLNEEQKRGLAIFKTLAVQPNSEILMAPLSDKYYIRNEEIFIVLDANRLSIINSVYHYDIYYSESDLRYLVLYIRRIIERRQEKLEATMLSKIAKSLTHLELDIKHKFNKKGEA